MAPRALESIDIQKLISATGGADPPIVRAAGGDRIQDGSAAAQLGEAASRVVNPRLHQQADYNAAHNNSQSWRRENGGRGVPPPSQHWLTSWLFR